MAKKTSTPAMQQQEIDMHATRKMSYPTYPKLPNIVYAEGDLSTGHAHSVVAGFKKRVANWINDHSKFAEELPADVEETLEVIEV